MAPRRDAKRQLKFRIIVEDPLAGVTYAVQRGRSDLLAPVRSTKSELVFEFPLTVADIDTDPPRMTGEFSQGPAKQRFVYVNSGSIAGQKDTCWTRRAKVPIHGLKRSMLAKAMKPEGEGFVLEARIHGLAKDGGPACATVPLLLGWSLSGPA
jgi:hypothetical protein